MIYLDTGCLVKLYYPEPDSVKVIQLVQGQSIAFSPLHELELVNALQLKVFAKGATTTQAAAARALVECDTKQGLLISVACIWPMVFEDAVRLAAQFSDTLGCRSLDILHCSAAKLLGATKFISTDARQKKLAIAMGLNLISF